MKCLKRNKQTIWFCNPADVIENVTDADGHLTGEKITTYTQPEPLAINVSPATGVYRTEEFGSVDNYDKVLLTDDINCPINEKTVLFVDKEPTRTESEFWQKCQISGGDVVVHFTVYQPMYDYIVWRVSKSLNSVAIAIKKVPVGEFGAEEPYNR